MILLIKSSVGRYEKIGFRMPLGLLYIATYLKKHNIPSKIIDTRVNKRWEKELNQALEEANIVGITCMIGPEVKNALNIARFIKTKKPNITIVFGGIHPTLMPEEALKKSCIDIVVREEGEKPMLEIANKRPLPEIRGISYKKIINSKEKIIHNPPQELLKPEEIPIPDYSFIDMDKYSATSYYGEKGLSIQASRGCPFSCGFCYHSNFVHRPWRAFPIDNVLKNIDILVKEHGANTIYFVDDNAAVNQKRFLEILRKIKQKPHKINLAFQGIRIDTLEKFTDEIYELLRESGVKSLDIGVETFNEKYLKMIDKHLKPKQSLLALERLERLDFNLKINFIAGFPGQTKEEIDLDIQQAKKLERKHKNSYVLYNIYMPFPGTKLYSEALKAGFKPPRNFEGWSIFAGTSWMKEHSWFPVEIKKYLQDMSFLFLFSNKNILTKVSNKTIKTLAKIYLPLARFRLRYKFYHFMIESKLAEFLD